MNKGIAKQAMESDGWQGSPEGRQTSGRKKGAPNKNTALLKAAGLGPRIRRRIHCELRITVFYGS
jgi:hypothetical protein